MEKDVIQSTQTPTTNEQQVEEVETNEVVEEVEKPTITQKQYDNALAKVRKSYEKKIANIEKRPILEKALIENGCKKEAINDFLKLNKDLFDCADEELKDFINKKSQEFKYMFEKKAFTADPFKNVQVNEPDKQIEQQLEAYRKQFFGK